MTREEKITVLKDIIDGEIIHPQVRRDVGIWAIKALEQDNCPYYVIDEDGHGLCKNHRLEQEPCDDAISRQAVLDILEKEGHKWGNDYRDWVDAIEEIKKLPPVNPQEPKWNMLLNWLNDMRFGIAPDETVTDIDELYCREAQTDILDEIMDWMKKQTPKGKCLLSQKFKDWQFIHDPKTGHWIKDDITERSKSAYKHKCDRCGAYHRAMYDYCPSCGARMIEPQESDHKCHDCKHYTSGEYDGSCDSYICEHYSAWESDNCN